MSFADNLKRYREAKGISQAELAALVGITQPMIAQYEKGLKTPGIIAGTLIAKCLDTTCEKLVNNETEVKE